MVQPKNGRRRGGGVSTALESALELPENLGARCSLLYMWDEEFTIRALEGYLQFMELKTNFEDWDCEQLAPSVVIDLVWQQHLLYNRQYNQACLEYCGQLIGYDPEANLFNTHLQEQKIQTTKIALKALYGRSFDDDIWNFQQTHSDLQKSFMQKGKDSNSETGSEARQDNQFIRRDDTISDSEAEPSDLRTGAAQSAAQQGLPSHRSSILPKSSSSSAQQAATSNNKSGESVTVKIKCFVDGKTQDTCIRVKRTTKMKKVEDCLARLMNLDGAENIRFLVDGEQVSPWETLDSMKVTDPEQHWFTVMPKVSSYQ